MKPRSLLHGILIGVLIAAPVVCLNQWGVNEQWKREAWEHYCGVYYTDYSKPNAPIKWAWMDDYFRLKQIHPPVHNKFVPLPTPANHWEKL